MLYRDRYDKEGMHFVVIYYWKAIDFGLMYLEAAFNQFFKDHSMVLKEDNWIEEVQRTLTNHSSAGHDREMKQTAFTLLCSKAAKVNKDLTDIQKLQVRSKRRIAGDLDEAEWGSDEKKEQFIAETTIVV